MKSFKRITSLIIALTMIAAMFTNVAFAQGITFSDVAQDNAHYQAIYNLVNRGVLNGYEDGTFKPDNTITRAEFAKVIMVSELGDANISASLVANFSDTNGHWASRYIAAAVNAGIINGYPEGTFKPDNTVTYAEAVKMVVCALGYGPVIDTTLNPWYSGYIKQASSIGATKNAVAVADNGASRGIVAQLIDNMDDCQRLVQTGTDASGNPIFTPSDMFSDDEITDGYGVLVGVYENSLIGTDSTLTKSQIQIDSQVYLLDDGVDYTSLERYIGYNVDYKIRKTTGNRFYVSNIVANNGTKVVTLDADYIEDYSGNNLSYYVDDEFDETDDYKIDDNLYVVYNGYGVPASYIDSSFKADIFDIDAGSVTLYNNDGDSAMDVAIVEKYQTYFVDTATKKTKEESVKITDKLKIQPDITLYDDDIIATKVTTAGGSEISATYTSINDKQVVSVGEPHSSAPADVPTIVKISTASVSGTVEKMQGDYEIVTVKSKDYTLAPCFSTFLATGDNEATYGFEVGSTVKFFLDYAGRIVCTDVTEKTASYGYLIDHHEGSGIDSGVKVKVLTISGKLEEFALASNVSINGGSGISPSAAIAELKASSAVINANKADEYKVEDSVEQLITYETNSKGKINKIGTVGTGTDGQVKPYEFTHNGSVAKKIFADCKRGEKLYHVSSTFKSADNKTQFVVDSRTIVFYIPYGNDRNDADKFEKYTKSKFIEGNYYVEPYEKDGSVAKVVVWYGGDGDDIASITAATQSVIITSKDRTTNSDGQEIQSVTYMPVGSTSTSTAFAESSSLLSGVETGDVVKLALSDDEIEKVQMIYDISEDDLYDPTGSVESTNYVKQSYAGDSAYYQAHVGFVYDRPEDSETGILSILKYGETDDYSTYSVASSTKYYKYYEDNKKDKINTTDYNMKSLNRYINNESNATKVLVIAYDGVVKGIYVIE